MNNETFVFGSFELTPARRLLLDGGRPLRVGGRALDILITLVERAGETVQKDELIAQVWPHAVVEENTLRVHVAALRRVLGEGRAGQHYIANIPGRGYRFMAPTVLTRDGKDAAANPAVKRDSLPAPLNQVIGRAETIAVLEVQLHRHRLLTIVGPGGIGKTTVATAVVDRVSETYRDGVWFVSLASLSDPDLVPSALSATLGIPLPGAQPIPGLAEWLRSKHALIVFDSCEHVVGPVAELAETILRIAPEISVLATSREPLRADGEWLHRLASLDLPPLSRTLTSREALEYSAVQLFEQRVQATIDGFILDEENVPAVLEICRTLDGLPLALELAAARVSTFGVNGLAAGLDDRFALLTKGRRTALPRQQTLRATMDWSYELLEKPEQAVLRRLAVLRGNFTTDTAAAIACDELLTADTVIECVANLAAKSLLTTDIGGDVTYHRLLDTTCAYALEKLEQSGESGQVRKRHAEYYRDFFDRAETEWPTRPGANWLAYYGQQIDNVRVALDWAYAPGGDAEVALALTAAAVPVWVQMSLVEECRGRAAEALAGLAHLANPNPGLEMRLCAALGGSLLFTKGPTPETAVAWSRALEIAERLGDTEYQYRALWGLWVYHMNLGEFGTALILARQFYKLAINHRDQGDLAISDRMIGVSFHYRGDQAEARRHIERMLTRYVDPARILPSTRFLYDQKVVASVVLARILWLQGLPEQASHLARKAVEDAYAVNQPVTLCFALAEAGCPIALFTSDLGEADRYVSSLIHEAASHWLPIWQSWANRFKGTLLIRQGRLADGLELLQASLNRLPEASFQPRFTWFLGQLAKGLSQAGQFRKSLLAVDEALARSERNEDRWCLAELLRIKGEILVRHGGDGTAVEDLFMQSLDWARRQGAISWELRTAVALAQVWRAGDRGREARELLSGVYDRFTEGFATADLQEAKRLIDALA